MKTTLLAIAIATVALLGFSAEAQAGPGYGYGYPFYGGHYGGHYAGPSHGGHGSCAPQIYKVRTVVICRRQECRTGYYPCGTPYRYQVTVVTYRDIFSNGTSNTYTRVLG